MRNHRRINHSQAFAPSPVYRSIILCFVVSPPPPDLFLYLVARHCVQSSTNFVQFRQLHDDHRRPFTADDGIFLSDTRHQVKLSISLWNQFSYYKQPSPCRLVSFQFSRPPFLSSLSISFPFSPGFSHSFFFFFINLHTTQVHPSLRVVFQGPGSLWIFARTAFYFSSFSGATTQRHGAKWRKLSATYDRLPACVCVCVCVSRFTFCISRAASGKRFKGFRARKFNSSFPSVAKSCQGRGIPLDVNLKFRNPLVYTSVDCFFRIVRLSLCVSKYLTFAFAKEVCSRSISMHLMHNKNFDAISLL